MGYRYYDNISGVGHPATVSVVIDNSDDVQIGDAVKCLNGNLEKLAATSSQSVFGVIVDIVDKNGNSVFGSIAELGTASLSSTNPLSGTVTVASNNETVDLIAAKVVVDKNARFSVDVTGTVNTTVSSTKPGAYLNCDDENSVDETTATRTAGTARQFYSWGADPNDTTRLIVSINASEVYNNVDVLAA